MTKIDFSEEITVINNKIQAYALDQFLKEELVLKPNIDLLIEAATECAVLYGGHCTPRPEGNWIEKLVYVAKQLRCIE